MKKGYRYEVGILLNKDNSEYDCYNNVYDKNHSYYAEDVGIFETKEEVIKYVEDYISNGKKNTYGIIGIEDIEDSFDFKDIFDYEVICYDIENIFYCKYKNENNEIKDLWKI